jgi:hypothetical protein
MFDTFSIGVNRLIRIIPPIEQAPPLRPESSTLAPREGDEGDDLCDLGDTSSRVCLRQHMGPVARMNIIGEQLARHRPPPEA